MTEPNPFDTLADRIRDEAAQASRPGQMERLEGIAREVERLRQGAKTLGHIIESNGRAILDITGRHDLIGEDGDGDWGAVWEHLYELPVKTLRDAERRRERSTSMSERPCLICRRPEHEHRDRNGHGFAPSTEPVTAPRADLDELGRLLAEATPGVWKLWGMQVMADQDGTSNVDTAVPVAQTYFRDEHDKPRTWDAELIAQTHNALPALLAEVADLRETVARVKAELRSEDAHAVLYGVTGTHPESYGGVTKDEALECAGELLTRLTAALDGSR